MHLLINPTVDPMEFLIYPGQHPDHRRARSFQRSHEANASPLPCNRAELSLPLCRPLVNLTSPRVKRWTSSVLHGSTVHRLGEQLGVVLVLCLPSICHLSKPKSLPSNVGISRTFVWPGCPVTRAIVVILCRTSGRSFYMRRENNKPLSYMMHDT